MPQSMWNRGKGGEEERGDERLAFNPQFRMLWMSSQGHMVLQGVR